MGMIGSCLYLTIPSDFGEEYDQVHEIKEGEYSIKRPSGLKRFKNSCFLNTALQILIYQEDLSRKIGFLYQKLKRIPSKGENFASIDTWMKFFFLAKKEFVPATGTGILRHISLKTKLFPIGEQADACELLCAMLEDLKKAEKAFGEDSMAEKLFQINQKVSCTCNQCKKALSFERGFWGIPNCAWDEKGLQKNAEASLEEGEKENLFCKGCDDNNITLDKVDYELPKCLVVNFRNFKAIGLLDFLKEGDVTVKGKSYRVTDIVVYNGKITKGHYFIIKNFEGTGWVSIDNELIQKKVISNKITNVKMVVLTSK